MSQLSHGDFNRAVEISSDIVTVLTRLQLPLSSVTNFDLAVGLPANVLGGADLFSLNVHAQIAMTVQSAYTRLHPDYGRLPDSKIERLPAGYRIETREGAITLPYTRQAYPGTLTLRIAFNALLAGGTITIPALGVSEPLSKAIDRVLGAGLGKELVTFGIRGNLWLDGSLQSAKRNLRIDSDLPASGANLANNVPVALLASTKLVSAVVDESVVDTNLFFLALVDLAEGIAQQLGASPAQLATLGPVLRNQLVTLLEGAFASMGPALLDQVGSGDPGSGTTPGEFMLYRPSSKDLKSGTVPAELEIASTDNGVVLLMNDVANPASDASSVVVTRVQSQDPAQAVAASLISPSAAMAITVSNAALLAPVATAVEKALKAPNGSLTATTDGIVSAVVQYEDNGTATTTVSGMRLPTGEEVQVGIAIDAPAVGGAVNVHSYLELGLTFSTSVTKGPTGHELRITPKLRKFSRTRTRAQWWAIVVAVLAAPIVAPALIAVPVVGGILPVFSPVLQALVAVGLVAALQAIVASVADAAAKAALESIAADATPAGLVQGLVPLSASATLSADSRDDGAVSGSSIATLPSSTTGFRPALRSRPDLVVQVGFRAINENDSSMAPVGVITCVVPDSSGLPNGRIDAVDVQLADGVSTRLEIDTAISLLENGHLALVIESPNAGGGPPIRNEVVVKRSRNGTAYLTTNPDVTAANNFSALPECS